MRREPGAAGRTEAADPAGAWVKEWRRLLPPPGVWWRKSAFDLARARRRKRLPALAVAPPTPAATFRIWLATRRLSLAARWNRRAEAADAYPLLSALDPHQRRAAACFEDRAMVTAGAERARPESSNQQPPTLEQVRPRIRRLHFAGTTCASTANLPRMVGLLPPPSPRNDDRKAHRSPPRAARRASASNVSAQTARACGRRRRGAEPSLTGSSPARLSST